MKLELLHKGIVAVVIAAAANLVLLLANGGAYDLHFAFLHAHGLFKPILILNGAFLAAVLLGRPRGREVDGGAAAPLILAALAALALSQSFIVNPLYDEWNYRGYSSTHDSLGGLAHLFASSQIGVWYRPFGFVSLWLDYALFHDHVWAYHWQNLLLHFANAFLAMKLGRRLGLSAMASRWAGALFLAAAVTYEPAMWPSARFDLWAMFFTACALIAALRFLTGESRGFLVLALACYSLGIASKESGYAFPILLTVIAVAWPFALRPPDRIRRMAEMATGIVVVTGGMLAIRAAVLGGTGGYPGTSSTPSPHLAFTFATVRILLLRAMQLAMLSVNLNYPTPAVMLIVVGAFAVVLAAAALAGASTLRRHWLLVACVFAAAVPVAPIVSWIDFNAQHVRYLYMPAFFVAMLMAAALSNARRATLLLCGFGFLNLCCGFYNTWVYKTTYRHSLALAQGISHDIAGMPAAHVTIVGMPPEYNGVLFSQFELQYRLQELRPDAVITFEDKGACSDAHCYLWQPEQRALQRITGH